MNKEQAIKIRSCFANGVEFKELETEETNTLADELNSAIEKQIPKKAEYHHKANGECALTICPNCESGLIVTRFAFPLDRYCKQCGQRYIVNILNWEVEE